MSYIAKALPVCFGCDTSAHLNATQAATIAAANLKFIVRTVPYSGGGSDQVIDATELAALTAAGLGVLLYQTSRTSGWSATTGQQDGAAAAHAALSLGYPSTCTLYCDLSLTTAAISISYVNEWCSGAVAAGMNPSALGLYCEPGVPLTSEQLYSLSVQRYWRTGGTAQNVDTRGYSMIQAWPGNITLSPGIVIDYNMAQGDYLGGHPVACFA